MSMLARFRKPGGFVQLLQLIESCEGEKQKNLIQLIATEDPGWASLVKAKQLTYQKVLTWPQPHLALVLENLPYRTLRALVAGSQSDQRDVLSRTLSPSLWSRLLKDLDETKLEPNEYKVAQLKLFGAIRELDQEGKIKLTSIDHRLELDPRLVA